MHHERSLSPPPTIVCSMCSHSITPLLTRSKKDKSRRYKKGLPDQRPVIQTFHLDKESTLMYLSYLDAIAGTLKQFVTAEGKPIQFLIDRFQETLYFDKISHTYVHPQIIASDQLEYLISHHNFLKSQYKVDSSVVYLI